MTEEPGGIAAPFRQLAFRRIWGASLFSNLGQHVQAVGAGWLMLTLTHRADMVAMVQTATMAPILCFALAAGAIADMYDRRKVAIAALGIAFCGAAALALLSLFHLISPPLLLLCCFVVGTGTALYSPAWQSSAVELVGRDALPAAVALYSISNNVARSVGPALGGVLVASLGSALAFGVNALLFLPLMLALLFWRRRQEPPRLPPERIDRAVISGMRYVGLAPPIRRVILRSLLCAFGGSVAYALLAIVARDVLHGSAMTYGLLLGSFGLGAVTAALAIDRIRAAFGAEGASRISALLLGSALLTVAVSRSLPLSTGALLVAGAGWMTSISMFNISVQLASPRWVSGRALAAYQAAVGGGLAVGSWCWGRVAEVHGVPVALAAAGLLVLGLVPLSRWLKLPDTDARAGEVAPRRGDPAIALDLSGRSGPITLEVIYRVDPGAARDFYHAARRLQRSFERNGAYAVAISRDITDEWLWIFRFHYPTWHDYLRARTRATLADRELQAAVTAFHAGDAPPIVRRMLERPFGSVRWKANAPDPTVDMDAVLPLPPQSS
ncbi:MAG: MFS transporter [Candidatus Sphingomonas phytovorans]|nr:MFS transporter [Sphingomonas sp.]WEK02230.1 MAG: MFS transporter [Sphingomonas sp.]